MKCTLLSLFAGFCLTLPAQQVALPAASTTPATKDVVAPLPRVYDEDIDAMQQIEEAVAEAQRTGKNVMCQVGGNWCKWCLRFADFVKKDAEISQVIDQSYVYIHVNYPRQNPGPLLERLGNPGRFGYPVMVVLSAEGKVVHIQDSSFLESGDSYDQKKVLRFLKLWTPQTMSKN